MLKQLKKYISLLLTLCMCLSTTGVLAYAAPESEEVLIVENTDTNNNITSEMDILYDISNLDEANFATKRLVVLVEGDSDIVNPEYVIGQYDNLYLLQYETVEQAMNAYSYYVDHSVTVEPDCIIYAADDTDTEITDIEMSVENNPVQNAATLTAVDKLSSISLQPNRTIALIDTGVDEEKAIERVSVLDEALCVGTHGNEMADACFTQNKEAKIVSIRALDENGNGTVSSVVAALQYAVDNKLEIINLSLEAKRSLASAVLEKAIKNAVDAGIYVVGSAGNDNDDVKNYIPGSITEAYIVGSANEDGTKADFSNYGETVDYNIVSTSTSEAAALFSGYVSRYDVEDIELNGGLIYETNYVNDPSDEEVPGIDGELEDTGHRIRTKASFIDGTHDTDGLTIDDVMATEENYTKYFLFQKEYFTTVFDNGDKDYYVAYLDTPYERGISSKRAIDVAFARDNYRGEVIDGCKYNYETGIAYIPREYIDTYEVAEEETFTLQSQLLCPYISDNLGMKEVKVPVTVENKLTGESIDTTALAQVMEDTFTVSLVDAGSADKVNVSSIEVFLNDNAIRYTAVSADDFDPETMSLAETAVYDDTTGDLLIPVSVAGVHNLHVAFDGVDTAVSAQTIYGNSTILAGLASCGATFNKINLNTLAGKVNHIFVTTGYRDASGDYLTTRNPNSWGPGNTSTSDNPDVNWHNISSERSLYTLTPIITAGHANDTNLRTKNYSAWAVPGLTVRWGTPEQANFDADLMNMDWSFTSSISTRLYKANCTHINTPYFNTNGQGETPMVAKIIGVDTAANKVAISFTAYRPADGVGQTCTMALVFDVKPQTQNLTIEKQSSDTRVFLTGAQFTLHSYNVGTKKYNDTPIATSVDNGNGRYTFQNVDVARYGGNYLIKEVKAPTNYSNQYELFNDTDKKQYADFGGREIEWNGSEWVKHGALPDYFLVFLDPPKLQNLTIEKQAQDTREYLTGAQFTLHLYNPSNNTYNSTPVATSVDNGNGRYTFQNIDVRMGGNYLIKEVKAPPGYSINYELFNDTDRKQYEEFGGREIEWDGGAWLAHGDLPPYYLVFLDPPKTANLKINKVITEKDIWWAHGNPSFLFEVTGTDVDGKAHAYNRMVTFTKEYVDAHTDSNGNILLSTTITNIPSGNYMVAEKKVSRFGLVDVTAQTSNITVTMNETGKVYDNIKTITATVAADLRATDGEVTYFNRRITWDKYGHTDSKVNTFTIATT